MNFDELNSIANENMRSMDYEDYFGEMDLTEEDKKKRIELAERFENDFLYILSLVLATRKYSDIQWEIIRMQLQARYEKSLQGMIDIDEYIENYVKEFSNNMIQSTKDNVDDKYTTSYDRARFMAENESNTVFNHQDLADAIASGKTKKRWVTMHDRRVRKTHQQADGQTVGIREPFLVGDSAMLVPKDSETYGASARECVNCRCTVKYY